MKTYPIALELTAWLNLELNQYEISIDEVSKISIKRTDDVLHTRELTSTEVDALLKAIKLLKVPVVEEFKEDPINKASSSYELIVESAHFSLEFNWEEVDRDGINSNAFDSIVQLATLIAALDQFH